MKKLISVLLIVVILLGCACADVITIDTNTASVEEMETAIEALKAAVKLKKGEQGPEMHTFVNGMSVGVIKAEKKDNMVIITYKFSHQDTEPKAFGPNIRERIYQNGIELENEFNMDDYRTWSRSVLSGAEIEAQKRYYLIDNSPLTIYLDPWFSQDIPYVLTIEMDY